MSYEFDPGIAVTASFPSTNWSLIIRVGALASSEAQEALTELCSLYWYPPYAFIRSKGNDPEQALDLTQSYFERLLEKGVIARADRGKGRFRSFLRTDCHHFLIDDKRRQWVRARVLKHVSINAGDAENRYRYEPADEMTPDRLFDRAWAMTVLNRVLGILADEYAAKGRSVVFDRLKVVLTQEKGTISSATLAVQLGKTEGAVNVSVHRLKRRYREILQELIAETLDDPSEIDDEIRSLFDAIRS
jgi:RNA polymerase sigma-70 factor (ECF subfamily)